jgi:serine protease Do
MSKLKPGLPAIIGVLMGFFLIACQSGSQAAQTASSPLNLAAFDADITTLVKLTEPALTRIDVAGPGFTAGGSGFIVDPSGYVVTNYHVIDGSSRISITLKDGESYSASVAASDSTADIALLKLASAKTDFAAVSLGSSSEVKVGEGVLAAGFPLGSDLPGPASFNLGIISALRSLKGRSYLQTDAIINPGNSGGCLVDFKGKVIGVTTSGVIPPGVDSEGIGLVIPIDQVKAFLEDNLP